MFLYLQPGEAFEHIHNHRSITTLIEGEVVLEMEGTSVELEPGKPTPVDANVAHRLVNVGLTAAMSKCVHVKVRS